MKKATPSFRSGIREYGRRLRGLSNLLQIIFFIEINPDISLGMDLNCILVALFKLFVCLYFLFLFFCVIYTHNHYVHGEFQSPTKERWVDFLSIPHC